jgi:hypothetical protein
MAFTHPHMWSALFARGDSSSPHMYVGLLKSSEFPGVRFTVKTPEERVHRGDLVSYPHALWLCPPGMSVTLEERLSLGDDGGPLRSTPAR